MDKSTDTRILAYNRLMRDVTGLRLQVMKLLAEYSHRPHWMGLTDREIEVLGSERFGPRAETSYRKRRSELTIADLVEEAEFTRVPKTGHSDATPQRVWRLKSPEEIQRIANGDVATYLRDNREIGQKRKKPAKDKPDPLADTRVQAKLMRAEQALREIMNTCRQARINQLDDKIFRLACDGLGLDVLDEAAPPGLEEPFNYD